MSKSARVLGVLLAAGLALVAVFIFGYGASARFRAFVTYGADLEQSDLGGWRPLHRAAAEGDVRMLEYLLAAGVDKNARTVRGETAWHLAEKMERSRALEVLERAAVDRSVADLPEIVGPYLGQTMPGATPELFMPGVVSGHYRAHSPCVFSPSLTTVYWTIGMPPHGAVETMRVEGDGYRWSRPELAEMSGEPSFSPDGRKLFFLSHEPLAPGAPGGEENLWVKQRTEEGWSEPRPLSWRVNARRPHFHHSVDRYGNLYFSDYDTLYYSAFRDGEYQEPVDLALLTGNDTLRGNSPYVTPGADLLLFAARRGLRRKELFVSFRRPDGTWSESSSLGPEINAGRLNDSPRLTPAGNFLFFVSAGEGRPWGIYWASAAVLDPLKRQVLGTDEPPGSLVAPRGSTPRIDGVFSPGEWDDAAVVDLTATKQILAKHDGETLFLALNAVGGDLFLHRGERVEVLHSSFALARADYLRADRDWALERRTDIRLHGLQNRPADEIDAALASHLEKEGWAASLIPMGSPYETEYAISLAYLGREKDGEEPAAFELPAMATRHTAGPPSMRPTWPPGLRLVESFGAASAAFEVERWGRISLALDRETG